MQVLLQPLSQPASPGSVVVIDTNPKATVETLISTFCTQKGIAFNSKLAVYDGKKRLLPQYSTLGSLGISNGQNLLIGYKDTSFTLKNRWPLLVALGALVIGIIGIFTMSMVYGLSGGKYPNDYGVVMDAGSTKTNTIVYKWLSNKHKGTGCVTQEATCLSSGGIAKMNPMKLDPVINCAQQVTQRVEPESRPKTPLYFAATAGMRLLNLTDPDKVDDILYQLNQHLNETKLSVKAIEIITGRDEGIYGWISANFLQNTLETEQKTNPWIPTTLGALDMGGASMQISYALPDDDKKHDRSDTKSLELYGQTHDVFSVSYLCFGREEAQRRYRALLIIQQGRENKEIVDPCLPSGYTINATGSTILGLPCTLNNMPPYYDYRDTTILEHEYKFVGKSDYKNCKQNITQLLDANACSSQKFKECFKKLDNLLEDQKYLAFATFFFTTEFLKLTESTLDEYEKGTQSYCGKTYAEIKQMTNNSYAMDYCFNAQYIHSVLIDGFGFRANTWKNLEFVGQIAGKDVGWTLGYMINATNIIPQKRPSPRLISSAALTVSLVLFILIVIATAVFLVHRTCHKGSNANDSVQSLYGTP